MNPKADYILSWSRSICIANSEVHVDDARAVAIGIDGEYDAVVLLQIGAV